jgi:hypothetical protein
MATMLPGGRSTFNSAGPNVAAAPADATAAPATASGATDPNSAAITAAAAALGTTTSTTSASPFDATSNLNFSGAASTPSTGTAVGGGIPNPNAVQGPQYAPAVASQPFNSSTNYPTISSGEGLNQFLQATGFESGSPDQPGTMPLAGRAGGDSPARLTAFNSALDNYRQQQSLTSPIPGLSVQQFLTEEQTPGSPYYGGSYGLTTAQMNAMLVAQGATPSNP